jgi:hypothetical protein
MEMLWLEFPLHRALLVMDTRLQHVPPNLVLISGELSGRYSYGGSAFPFVASRGTGT